MRIRRRNVLIPLFLALSVSWSAQANVNYFSGAAVATLCKATTATPEGSVNLGMCRGFLASVVDTYTTIEDWEKLKPYLCVPRDTPVATLREVFLDYLQVHPEDWQKAASSLALNAFNERWPCPATQ